jgi:hypothetical protein
MLLYLLYIEQPFCRYFVYFCIDKWYAGSALHDKRDSNCSCGSNYWNGIGTNNCGYIDEVDETFSIANGTVSATGTIIDNNNAPTGNDASASKECVYLH